MDGVLLIMTLADELRNVFFSDQNAALQQLQALLQTRLQHAAKEGRRSLTIDVTKERGEVVKEAIAWLTKEGLSVKEDRWAGDQRDPAYFKLVVSF